MAQISQLPTPSSDMTSPGSLSQSIQECDAGALDREYNFFVTTDSQHAPDGLDRGLIRRLVMRNFFETRCANAQVDSCASAHTSANTVLAKKQLKSRFRLADVGAKTKRSRKASGNKSKETMAADRLAEEQGPAATVTKKKRPKASRTTSASTITSTSTCHSASPPSTNLVPSRQSSHPTLTNRPQARFHHNPSPQLLDPFDVLPIPSSPHLNFLFKLYKSTSPLNALATNPSSTWWSFISCSATLLHATLATWALYGLLVSGGGGVEGLDLVEWGLRHKSEAIKGVNAGIGTGGGVSEEVVGCVVVVASFENLQGTYDAAHLHVVALQRMVHAKGGLDALKHNEGLVKGIIWVDFHTSTAHHTPPSFPFVPPSPSHPPLPDPLQEEAACTSPTSLLHLSLAPIECFNIFYRLHRLGLALSPRWLGRIDRRTLSDMLYEVEYMILNVPDHSRVYVDFDMELDGGREEYEARRRDADAAAVVEATMAACQIFVYAALRGVPWNAKIFGILLERVRRAVERSLERSLFEVWSEQGNANVLLWVLILACSVAGERAWYVERVGEVLDAMRLETKVEMEMALRNIAWVDGYFDSVALDVWENVVSRRRQPYVLDDGLSSSVDADSVLDSIWDMVGNEHGVERT